jgi:transcriptional regulator with PAS, ATPase and Fis domain
LNQDYLLVPKTDEIYTLFQKNFRICTNWNFIDPGAEKITGIKQEEAVGRYITDFDFPSWSLEVIRIGVDQPTQKVVVGKNRKYLTTRTPSKERKVIKGVVNVFQDISEISEELDSVRKLNQQFEAIIGASYD